MQNAGYFIMKIEMINIDNELIKPGGMNLVTPVILNTHKPNDEDE